MALNGYFFILTPNGAPNNFWHVNAILHLYILETSKVYHENRFVKLRQTFFHAGSERLQRSTGEVMFLQGAVVRSLFLNVVLMELFSTDQLS